MTTFVSVQSNNPEPLIQYLRASCSMGSLKTTEFISEVQVLLDVSKKEALELSKELAFEDGKLNNVNALFDMKSPATDKPLLSLYLDSIKQCVTNRKGTTVAPVKKNDGTVVDNQKKTDNDKGSSPCSNTIRILVDAMVADLYKICRSTYALESSQFIDVALRHDLRRSESWRLLKPMGFKEGLCVSSAQKWFDNQGQMKLYYYNVLGRAYHTSMNPNAEETPTMLSSDDDDCDLQEPSWAMNSNRLQKKYKQTSTPPPGATTPTTTGVGMLHPHTYPRKNDASSFASLSSPLSFHKRRPSSPTSWHNDDVVGGGGGGDDEEVLGTSALPDWASSHKWKKRIQLEFGDRR